MLRNREDNYIVYEEYGKNVYQATSPEIDEKFGIIHVHLGFRYKPILLNSESSVGIIIEPKSKFFSESTLRDLWDQNKVDYYSDKNTEKICCVQNCPDYLNPFGICELNYPSYFGNIRDLKFVNENPSKTVIDLIDYYKNEKICATGLISDKIIDKEPIIQKFFWNNPEKVYSYPLDIIRVIPDTSDAGSDAKSLMRKIQPKPFERFKLIKDEYSNVISDIRDINFPIIPEGILSENSSDIEKVELNNPTYLLRDDISTEFPSIEYNDKGFYSSSCNGKEFLFFHLLYFKSDKSLNVIENLLRSSESKHNKIETYQSFSKVKNIKLTKSKIRNLEDVKKIVKSEESTNYHFYVIIVDMEHLEIYNNVKAFLIEKDIPNQSINLNTLNNLGYGPLRSLIYLQIYLKSGGKTWILEEVHRKNEIIVGLNVKFFKNHIVSSLLFFTNQGDFIEGRYIDKEPERFKEEFFLLLKRKLSEYSKILIYVFGSITSNILESIEELIKIKDYSIISIKYTSLVRLFEQDDNKKWMIYPPKPGSGVILNNQSGHIITSKTKIGTPSCIKIRNLASKSNNINEILEKVFKFTRFNPALVRNETKLPFPLHFARSTLQKGIQYNLDSFDFKIPFYL